MLPTTVLSSPLTNPTHRKRLQKRSAIPFELISPAQSTDSRADVSLASPKVLATVGEAKQKSAECHRHTRARRENTTPFDSVGLPCARGLAPVAEELSGLDVDRLRDMDLSSPGWDNDAHFDSFYGWEQLYARPVLNPPKMAMTARLPAFLGQTVFQKRREAEQCARRREREEARLTEEREREVEEGLVRVVITPKKTPRSMSGRDDGSARGRRGSGAETSVMGDVGSV